MHISIYECIYVYVFMYVSVFVLGVYIYACML